jgi:biotin carboxyl carrier protein
MTTAIDDRLELARLLARLTHFSLPIHPDGRRARISDGVNLPSLAGYDPTRRQHRGFDAMYRKPARSAPRHPWSSPWYEVPEPPARTPVLARGAGVVVECGRLNTGSWVVLDHGDGLGTAAHHLAELLVEPGQRVGSGQPIGILGGSPIGYGLVHDHEDTAVGCAFNLKKLRRYERLDGRHINPAPFMRAARHVTVASAWFIHYVCQFMYSDD